MKRRIRWNALIAVAAATTVGTLGGVVVAPVAQAEPGAAVDFVYAQDRHTGDVVAIPGDRPTVPLTFSGPRITKLVGAWRDGSSVQGLTAAGEFVSQRIDGSPPVVYRPPADSEYTDAASRGKDLGWLLTSKTRNSSQSQIVAVTPSDPNPKPLFLGDEHCDREINATGLERYLFERGRLVDGVCQEERAIVVYLARTQTVEPVMALDADGVEQPLSGRLPSLSPDGRWLAYYEPDSQGGGLLKVLDMVTKRHKSLPSYGGATMSTPRWAPDSSMFHFDVDADPMTLDISTGKVAAFGDGRFVAAVPIGRVEPTVGVRVWGNDAIGTAIATSRFKFDAAATAVDDRKAKVAVLTRSDEYYDGLAGSGLAGAKRGPMLFTPKSGLASGVSSELVRVLAKGSTVYVLGGTGALSANVENQVRALGFVPKRLAGADIAGTGVAIAKELTWAPSLVLVASADQYYDALVAGAMTGRSKEDTTVVFTWGGRLPDASLTYLRSLDSNPNDPRVLAIGGPAARAMQNVYEPTETLVGTDAADTARLVAMAGAGGQEDSVALVSQESWQDGLAGGAFIAGQGSLLLTSKHGLPKATSDHLATIAPTKRVVIVGGRLAVPQAQAETATARTSLANLYDMVDSPNGNVKVPMP